MSENKHTQGPVDYHRCVSAAGRLMDEFCIKCGKFGPFIWTSVTTGRGLEQAEADIALIAEAFNVSTETGLTPRQLADQRAELLEACEALLSAIDAHETHLRDRGVGYLYSQAELDALDMINAAIAKARGE